MRYISRGCSVTLAVLYGAVLKHQLLIDQSVAKNARSRCTNLAMSWVDYKKAYNSVPHLWKLECLRLYKIDPRLVTFIRQSMSHWRTILSANSKSIANVTINIDIDKSYKYLKILQLFGNNDEEVRCKANSEYRNPVRLVLMSKFFSKNKVTEIDTFSIPVIRYSAAVVSWRRGELKETNTGAKKLMTMHCVPSQVKHS